MKLLSGVRGPPYVASAFPTKSPTVHSRFRRAPRRKKRTLSPNLGPRLFASSHSHTQAKLEPPRLSRAASQLTQSRSLRHPLSRPPQTHRPPPRHAPQRRRHHPPHRSPRSHRRNPHRRHQARPQRRVRPLNESLTKHNSAGGRNAHAHTLIFHVLRIRRRFY